MQEMLCGTIPQQASPQGSRLPKFKLAVVLELQKLLLMKAYWFPLCKTLQPLMSFLLTKRTIVMQDGPTDGSADEASLDKLASAEADEEEAVDNLSDVPSTDNDEEEEISNHCISQYTKVSNRTTCARPACWKPSQQPRTLGAVKHHTSSL